MEGLKLNELTDEELMEAYQSGSVEAFDVLFARYRDRIYRYFFLKLSNSSIVHELFQETFLKLHKNRKSFEKDRKFSAWIFTIASNLFKDELRRRSRRPADVPNSCDSQLGLDQLSDQKNTPEASAIQKSDIQNLKLALNKIPDDQREVILLHKYEDLSFQEIAAMLGEKVESVKSKAFRGYKNLRKILDPKNKEDR